MAKMLWKPTEEQIRNSNMYRFMNFVNEKFDQNLVFVLLRDNILTLCVFKNQVLDFIETEQYEADKLNCEECFKGIVEKINAILKFYELKLHDKCDKWKVNMVLSISDKSIQDNGLPKPEFQDRGDPDAKRDLEVSSIPALNKKKEEDDK